MWNILVGPLVELGKQWFKNKAEKAQATHEATLKKIQTDADWDATQANNANASWKDEWFAIVLSVPMIGAFIPDFVPYIQEGFNVLNDMPDYYKAFLGGAIAASFGIKTLSNWGK